MPFAAEAGRNEQISRVDARLAFPGAEVQEPRAKPLAGRPLGHCHLRKRVLEKAWRQNPPPWRRPPPVRVQLRQARGCTRGSTELRSDGRAEGQHASMVERMRGEVARASTKPRPRPNVRSTSSRSSTCWRRQWTFRLLYAVGSVSSRASRRLIRDAAEVAVQHVPEDGLLGGARGTASCTERSSSRRANQRSASAVRPLVFSTSPAHSPATARIGWRDSRALSSSEAMAKRWDMKLLPRAAS